MFKLKQRDGDCIMYYHDKEMDVRFYKYGFDFIEELRKFFNPNLYEIGLFKDVADAMLYWSRLDVDEKREVIVNSLR